jgi:hypothetical protein
MAMNKKQNNKREHDGGGPRPDNRKHRQEEAKERLEAWTKLSPQEQLKALDGRPGGSKKQRARIQARIDRPKVAAVAKTDEAFRKFGEQKAVERAVETERLKAKDRRAQERQDRPGRS